MDSKLWSSAENTCFVFFHKNQIYSRREDSDIEVKYNSLNAILMKMSCDPISFPLTQGIELWDESEDLTKSFLSICLSLFIYTYP